MISGINKDGVFYTNNPLVFDDTKGDYEGVMIAFVGKIPESKKDVLNKCLIEVIETKVEHKDFSDVTICFAHKSGLSVSDLKNIFNIMNTEL